MRGQLWPLGYQMSLARQKKTIHCSQIKASSPGRRLTGVPKELQTELFLPIYRDNKGTIQADAQKYGFERQIERSRAPRDPKHVAT